MNSKKNTPIVELNDIEAKEIENPGNVEFSEVEILRQEVERLKSELSQTPKSLGDRIDYFKRKQDLVDRLRRLELSINNVKQQSENVMKEVEEDVFTSENFAIKLTAKKGYSSEEDLFKFRNPEMINEVIVFLLSKMEAKRESLINEISA